MYSFLLGDLIFYREKPGINREFGRRILVDILIQFQIENLNNSEMFSVKLFLSLRGVKNGKVADFLNQGLCESQRISNLVFAGHSNNISNLLRAKIGKFSS